MKATEEHLELPYHFILEPTRDEEEGDDSWWFIKVAELPGCMSQGHTPDEAIERIKDAMLGWISIAQEDDRPIPEPRHLPWDGVRRLVEVPAGLFDRLEEVARREGVDVETLAIAALANAVGWPRSSVEAQGSAAPAAG